MTLKRLTPIKALERRIFNLESMPGSAGIHPSTIEQAIHAYFREFHGSLSAPALVAYAKARFGLNLKDTSVSAILCKLTRLGIIRKADADTGTFHTYKEK